MKRLALRVAPAQVIRRFAPNYPFEPEFALVPVLCDARTLAVDIGASTGIYTIQMLAHARACVAFEPRPRVAERLREKFCFAGPAVRIESVALSDRSGEGVLRVPEGDGGRSTIDADNPLTGVTSAEAVPVSMKRLDEVVAETVGFIKIDVEGHELSVLRGAERCLRQSRPALLMEIDDGLRPHTMRETSDYLAGLGYRGFFLWEGRVQDLDTFNPDTHQRAENGNAPASHGRYVRNFFFVHESDAPRLTRLRKTQFARPSRS
jgi:FkbM family methyltransferase